MKTSVSDKILIILVVIIIAIIIAFIVTQGIFNSKSNKSKSLSWFDGKWIYTKVPNVLFTSKNGVMLPPYNAPLKYRDIRITFNNIGSDWFANLFESGKKIVSTKIKFLPDNKSFSVEGQIYTKV